jgi:uncharacterized protein YndB with AHSA1/START domain
MRTPYLVAAALVSTGSLSAVLSATLNDVNVTLDHGRYQVTAETHLDAPPSAIYDVLTDFANDGYAQISEIYKESDYLEPDGDGTPIVYTRVEGCLLLFCRSMRRVERLEVVQPSFIRATVLPDRSDFKYSLAEWTLEPETGGTRVVYRMEMEPDFWLPPFVGPWFLKRTLLRGAPQAVDRIEELAQRLGDPDLATAARR